MTDNKIQKEWMIMDFDDFSLLSWRKHLVNHPEDAGKCDKQDDFYYVDWFWLLIEQPQFAERRKK